MRERCKEEEDITDGKEQTRDWGGENNDSETIMLMTGRVVRTGKSGQDREEMIK